MSDRKPTTVLVRIIGGEEYDDCAPELLAEDVMPGFSDGVVWEIVPDEITALCAALADERKRALEEAADLIKEFAVAMGRIAEHRKTSQHLAQAAIDTLEVVETLVRALREATK